MELGIFIIDLYRAEASLRDTVKSVWLSPRHQTEYISINVVSLPALRPSQYAMLLLSYVPLFVHDGTILEIALTVQMCHSLQVQMWTDNMPGVKRFDIFSIASFISINTLQSSDVLYATYGRMMQVT